MCRKTIANYELDKENFAIMIFDLIANFLLAYIHPLFDI